MQLSAKDKKRADALARYHDDLPWYAFDCLKIIDKARTERPLVMNPAQKQLETMAQAQRQETGLVRMVVPKARQLGVSTWVNARGFHRTQMRKNTSAFVITHRDDATANMLNMCKQFADSVPLDIVQPIITDNAKQYGFANRSQYRVGTAGGAGAKVGRSFTCDFFHWSECALCEGVDEVVSGAMQSVPMQAGTEVWLESTGRGPSGFFYDVAQDAVAGIGLFKMCFLPWFIDPLYRVNPPGTWEPPPKWAEYQETFELGDDQLWWAYLKNVELLRGTADRAAASGTPDEPCHLFITEYPSQVADCWMRPDANKLISALAVMRARRFELVTDESWKPILLGVDVAGEGSDSTTLIDRQGRRLGGHVFKKLKGATTTQIRDEILAIKRRLNVARCFVDVTGGLGVGVLDMCHELGADWVVGVQYAGKPINEKYHNKRAEIWWSLKEWIEDPSGVSIPDSDEVAAHILAPANIQQADRQKLEEKRVIRKREGFSPDWGDAAAQTFAEDVDTAVGVGDYLSEALGGHHMLEPMGY
jgi:hypothetical protein